MRGMVRVTVAALVLCAAGTVSAGLTVEERDGMLSVTDDGRTLVTSIEAFRGEGIPDADFRRSFAELADGTRVWNRWNETRDGRYRLEVAERPDGAIEITLLSQVDPFDKIRMRALDLVVPDGALSGWTFKALEGNSRAWRESSGTVDAQFGRRNRSSYRWFAAGGVTFDFNAMGPGDYINCYRETSIRGQAAFHRTKAGDLVARLGSTIRGASGGLVGAKCVIRKGDFDSYDRIHFVRTFHYAQHLNKSHLVAFASPKRGNAYTEGDVGFDPSRGFGWIEGAHEKSVGHSEGALYSCVRGTGRAIYRFTGLADGYYVFTVKAGNYAGDGNCFSVAVNGADIVRDLTVEKGTARVLSRAVHVCGGVADVVLDGNWVLSALGVQPLLGDQEDFSVSRGFWTSDGYDPSDFYHNGDYRGPFECRTADETYELPVPGTETAGRPHDPPAPVELPDPNAPELGWLANAKVGKLLANDALIGILDDPAVRKRYFDERVEGHGYTVLMGGGMHSRHTRSPRVIERGLESIRFLVEETHRRGLKYFDHLDATLMWNMDLGFRHLMERLPEMIRATDDGLPSYQLCPCNPVFCEKIYAYLRRLVEAGVDGFQIDELEFWRHGCTCAACRARFFRETGWRIPANECDAAFNDPSSELRRRWAIWRIRTVTNWFVEFRRRMKDLRKDLVLNMYTTHYGFASSLPRRGGSSDLLDLGRVVNYFGTEVMSRNIMTCARCMSPYRKAMGLPAAISGTPVWAIFYASHRYGDYFGWALANMHGQSALVGENPKLPDVPDFLRFGEKDGNMVRAGSTPIAEVALLFSEQSRDWSEGSSPIGELFGIAQELERLHVPYAMVSDRQITAKDLDGFKVLFVGSSNCLSDGEIAAIRDFARNGGTVYLSALAGTCNEIGIVRPAWAFGDLFGFRPSFGGDEVKGDVACGRGRMVYTSLQKGNPFFAKEVHPPAKSTFDPDPVAERAFAEELKALTRDAAYWRVKAPDKVYTMLWRERDGATVVHFLNATGCDLPAGTVSGFDAPKSAFPPFDEDIVFTVPFGGVKRVEAFSPEFTGARALPFKVQGSGRTTVRIPKDAFKAYMLVRIR